MKKRPLYRLPTFGRMEFRRLVLGALGLYVLALAILCWVFTQRFAWQFDYHPNLGEPWLELHIITAGASSESL